MRISDWSSDVCSSDLWVPYDGIADVRLEVRGEAHRLGGAVEEGVNAVAGDVLDPAAIVGDQFAKVTERVDRQSVVSGKSVSVRVDLGGRRIIKKKTHKDDQ